MRLYGAEWAFCHAPPWNRNPPYPPSVPRPWARRPIIPWDLTKLKEYYELLKGIKELEDKIGCPCEPNKADYLKMFKEQIEAVIASGSQPQPSAPNE